jgi:hypothetical protein
MDTKEKNCAERIGQKLKSTEEQVKAILAIDDYTRYEQLANLPLSIETVKETTVTLSWGGPSDYLHITHNDSEVLRVVYRFSDWFDTATEELDETSPLWEYAEDVISCL